jgi:hypothetical protein
MLIEISWKQDNFNFRSSLKTITKSKTIQFLIHQKKVLFFYSAYYIFITYIDNKEINNIINITGITWDELRIAKSVSFQKFNISIFAILRSVQNPK